MSSQIFVSLSVNFFFFFYIGTMKSLCEDFLLSCGILGFRRGVPSLCGSSSCDQDAVVKKTENFAALHIRHGK